MGSNGMLNKMTAHLIKACAKSLLPLMVSLSNHDSGNGGILWQAQDEQKPKNLITLYRPSSLIQRWTIPFIPCIHANFPRPRQSGYA